MRNIKLLVEYDGTNYVGWQRQDNGLSIQGEIESAAEQVLQEKANVIGAGRTDAGVHARGQTANFRTETKLTIEQIKGGLNGLLPKDIVVLSAEEVPLDFHARFSAKERHYSYVISLQPNAIERNFAWQLSYSLDGKVLHRCAEDLLGTHDFESFCKAQADVDHYKCDVTLSSWSIANDKLRYEIHANRFLHGMVRALVGTMIDVARGFTTLDDFRVILEKKDRTAAGMAAPAKGLVLEKVIY